MQQHAPDDRYYRGEWRVFVSVRVLNFYSQVIEHSVRPVTAATADTQSTLPDFIYIHTHPPHHNQSNEQFYLKMENLNAFESKIFLLISTKEDFLML